MKKNLPDNNHKETATNSDTDIPCEHLYQKAFENSLQANIILLVKDGSIIRVNKAACHLLKYSKKELLNKNRSDIFIVSDNYQRMMNLRNATGSARADLALITKTGKVLNCEITSVIFKDNDGTDKSILSIVDMSQKLLSQQEIDVQNKHLVDNHIILASTMSDSRDTGSNDWISSIGSNSYDVIWDCEISSQVISFGGNYEKVFGYKLLNNKLPLSTWISLFLPEERNGIQSKLNRILKYKRDRWKGTFQFKCPDGDTAFVIVRANTIRDHAGRAIRMIGVIHDLSQLHKLEETLNHEKNIRNSQISQAVVEAKELERSDIGKELHDNINQLLAASMLYLNLAREDITKSEIYLIHSSEYTLNAIEEIRKLTKGLTTDSLQDAGLCGTIDQVSKNAMKMYPIVISCHLDDSFEHRMGHDFRLNIFRIYQEQLNNIIKHASASKVEITVAQLNEGFILSIADNGIGCDVSRKASGIGIKNIISRAKIYNGKVTFESEPGKGFRLNATFPDFEKP